jgi:hypothetical protein
MSTTLRHMSFIQPVMERLIRFSTLHAPIAAHSRTMISPGMPKLYKPACTRRYKVGPAVLVIDVNGATTGNKVSSFNAITMCRLRTMR